MKRPEFSESPTSRTDLSFIGRHLQLGAGTAPVSGTFWNPTKDIMSCAVDDFDFERVS